MLRPNNMNKLCIKIKLHNNTWSAVFNTLKKFH